MARERRGVFLNCEFYKQFFSLFTAWCSCWMVYRAVSLTCPYLMVIRYYVFNNMYILSIPYLVMSTRFLLSIYLTFHCNVFKFFLCRFPHSWYKEFVSRISSLICAQKCGIGEKVFVTASVRLSIHFFLRREDKNKMLKIYLLTYL